MREDMAKVIVERPRHGGGVKFPRGSARATDRIPPDDWTPSLEGKFSGLVLKKARGKLTAKETANLSEMRLDRRRLLNPRSVEEITDGYRKWFATERLIAALDQYVKVHPRKTYTPS